MKNSIEWNGAEKRFDLFHLQPVTMNLEQGSIMGLIGENGSGKTTLIKLALNLISLSSGEIKILGLDSVKQEEQIKQKIGFVPDENIFYDMFTPKEINQITSKLYQHWDEKIYFDYLEKFSIPINKNIKSFSMGMKKKIAIASALSHEAEILILDEPMNGIDPVARQEMRDILQQFVENEYHSVLLSTHITEDLEKIADYITLIEKGNMIFYKNKDEILEKYGIACFSKNDFKEIDKNDYISFRENTFGYEVFVEDKKTFLRKYDGAIINNASLEDIMVFYHNV
ncbi:ABC transporter ATP-binding protein [Lachnospiraceae bacterium 46-61]